MIESKSKKQRKKQKIKQKQEDKLRDDPYKTTPKKMQDSQNNKKVLLNAHLIPVICENEENSPIGKSQLIMVKNQNLSTLQEEAVFLILNKSAIRVLGKDKNIPKSISLIQRVKRVLKQKHQKEWKQTNQLGVDQSKIACFQAILQLL